MNIIRRHKGSMLLGWLVLLASPLVAYVTAQDLEELLDEREREEQELRGMQDSEIPGVGDEPGMSRLLLPKGEDVERLLISQDREINPATYIVGPSDVLQLYVWGEFDQAIPVVVNPEGYALVPTIGSFHVGGLTLAEVRKKIVPFAQNEKYPGVEITVTLESMRFFTVYLTGAVLTEGAHTVHPITRISDLIEKGGGFLDDLGGVVGIRKTPRLVRGKSQSQPTARRSIKIIHGDESSEVVDLAMFFATGDVAHNPYVRMGDIIHVGYRRHQIFIYGSVNKEGSMEFRPGDTVDDLITLAGGMSGSAPLEIAELWRFQENSEDINVISLLDRKGESSKQEFFSVEDISHVSLEPKDMLFVRVRSDWQTSPTVHVHGEIKYRGRYRIFKGKSRLTDVIEQAGGFTKNANLVESRVIRARFRAQQDPELQRLRGIVNTAGWGQMSPEERAYFKSKGREDRGRLSIDFQRLYEDADQIHNILLEGGDVIFIAEIRQTVNVSGQVIKAGLVNFEEGRRVAYYLSQVGGYAFKADKRGARLIRARTGQRERLDKNALVEAGDEIWIPEIAYRDWWNIFQSTMRTMAEAAAIIVLARSM